MHIDDLVGRGASVKGLCEAFLSGAPAHATLLLGPEGVGKRTIADTLSQSLFCEGDGPKPCGECPGCRRYLAGSHPDVHRVAAQKRIGVDEIRELTAALSAAPYEAGWRVAIIELAGAMTTQAQNSLLKTLEEPPPKTVFFLTAISVGQLLPTIISRCQLVHVPPMAQEAVRQSLLDAGVAPERAGQIAPLAQGSIGKALSMHGDAGFWALRARVLDAMAGVRGPGDVLLAVNALKDDRPESARVCDLMESAIRDAMVAALTGEPLADAHPWQQRLLGLEARALPTLLENTAQMRRMLASNVSWQAVLERFLLEYTEEMHRWQS